DRGITDITIKRRAAINLDDVTLAQLAFRGNAVNDLLVDRSADRSRKSVIAFEGRIGARRANLLLGMSIQLARRHARLDHLSEVAQRLGDDQSGAPHLFNLAA